MEHHKRVSINAPRHSEACFSLLGCRVLRCEQLRVSTYNTLCCDNRDPEVLVLIVEKALFSIYNVYIQHT